MIGFARPVWRRWLRLVVVKALPSTEAVAAQARVRAAIIHLRAHISLPAMLELLTYCSALHNFRLHQESCRDGVSRRENVSEWCMWG